MFVFYLEASKTIENLPQNPTKTKNSTYLRAVGSTSVDHFAAGEEAHTA